MGRGRQQPQIGQRFSQTGCDRALQLRSIATVAQSNESIRSADRLAAALVSESPEWMDSHSVLRDWGRLNPNEGLVDFTIAIEGTGPIRSPLSGQQSLPRTQQQSQHE